MRLFPEPHIPNYDRDHSSGTGAGGALNSYSDANAYLRIPPHRTTSQRSSRNEGLGGITHPFNQSETSLDRTADLLDLVRNSLYSYRTMREREAHNVGKSCLWRAKLMKEQGHLRVLVRSRYQNMSKEAYILFDRILILLAHVYIIQGAGAFAEWDHQIPGG